MKDVAKSVIERINQSVGNDIKNLHNCKSITSHYANRVGEIEAEVRVVDDCNISICNTIVFFCF